VAIVEDSTPVRESLKKILEGTPDLDCVAVCASGEEALKKLPSVRPDVVLMDIGLPKMSGVECVKMLVQAVPNVLVVMLTVHDDDEPIFNSLAAGACGYLHKPLRAEELIAAINEVCAGGSPMTSNIARKVVRAFGSKQSTQVKSLVFPELTDRERTVLEYLARGYIYKEIADKMEVSWHTVHTHIRHVYEKLHVRSRTEAVAVYLGR